MDRFGTLHLAWFCYELRQLRRAPQGKFAAVRTMPFLR
jgi:hypothetical protein